MDPFGGRADLEAGILRHPSNHFNEYPLRVLRAVQFSGRFGMELAPETAELCREMAPEFEQLHKDGIWKEFHKHLLNAIWFPGWNSRNYRSMLSNGDITNVVMNRIGGWFGKE